MAQHRGLATVAAACVVGLAAMPLGAETSHLNRPIDDHVVLNLVSGGGDPASPCNILRDRSYRRVLPDGLYEPGVFEVPEGRRLVVTEVDWLGNSTGSDPPVGNAWVQLQLANPFDQFDNTYFFHSTQVPLETTRVQGNDQLTAGFAVDDIDVVCPQVALFSPPFRESGFRFINLTLRGYLIDVEGAGDGDDDGIPDGDDACPDTEADTVVDASGCSQRQFCAEQPVRDYEAATCRRADWMGDEEGSSYPKDCRPYRGLCVPY